MEVTDLDYSQPTPVPRDELRERIIIALHHGGNSVVPLGLIAQLIMDDCYRVFHEEFFIVGALSSEQWGRHG
jgi:hypothetical protein